MIFISNENKFTCVTFGYDECRFPDGTLDLSEKLSSFIIEVSNNERIYFDWVYEDDSELFTLYCLKKHFDTNFPHIDYYLFMPYVPNGRMDRTELPRDVFTLKYFCEIINSLNFKRVYIKDPHSDVTPALLNNCKIMSNYKDFSAIYFSFPDHDKINEKDVILYYPDAGSAKKYSKTTSGCPYTYGNKIRNWKTHRITSCSIVEPEKVKDKTVIIIDDICSYGGTINKSAEMLLKAGASAVYAYVTFAEAAILKGDLYNQNNVKQIYAEYCIGKWDKNVKIDENKLIFPKER